MWDRLAISHKPVHRRINTGMIGAFFSDLCGIEFHLLSQGRQSSLAHHQTLESYQAFHRCTRLRTILKLSVLSPVVLQGLNSSLHPTFCFLRMTVSGRNRLGQRTFINGQRAMTGWISVRNRGSSRSQRYTVLRGPSNGAFFGMTSRLP